MIDEIKKTVDAYRELDVIGKRLFRTEVGLERAGRANKGVPGRRRTASKRKGGGKSTTLLPGLVQEFQETDE